MAVVQSLANGLSPDCKQDLKTWQYFKMPKYSRFIKVTIIWVQVLVQVFTKHNLTTYQLNDAMASVSGLPVQPADIWITDIQAEMSSSMQQAFFTVQLGTWEERIDLELRDASSLYTGICIWMQMNLKKQKLNKS